MAVIDDRGRLFGRLNLVDAAVALLALVVVAFAALGYALFRLPNPPVVSSISPNRIPANEEHSLQLKGQHFIPYLRVYLGRTDEADFVKRPTEQEKQDAFTLMNATRVQFLLETPTLAEIKVPALGTGSYDLHFYDETGHVAVKVAAFEVVPQESSGPGTATLIVTGEFGALTPADANEVRVGDRVTSGDLTWGDVLSVEPTQPDVAPISVLDRVIPTPVRDLLQVPAKVRVTCKVVGNECRVEGTAVTTGRELRALVGKHPTTFRVKSVEADTAHPGQ